MSDTCTYNCSAHPTEISAYGDISGIGVTTAFFATAWIVVLLLIGYYFVAYDPELDPFRKTGNKTLCQYPNNVDYVFLHVVRKLPGLRSLQRTDWHLYSQLESALNKCVIMFADIQIFTGLAVMISGYIALSCRLRLQSYHWQLAVYLVWLASLTHLAALSFLRNHFSNHPNQLIWRVTAMFIMMMLLEVAVGLTGYFSWDKGPNKVSDFAVCYFGEKMDTNSVAFESMLKTLILLIYSFFIRLAKMSKPFEGGLRRIAARLTASVGAEPRDDRSPFLESMQYFGIALYSLPSIHINLITSFLAEVYWLTLSAIWATRRFSRTRLLGPKQEDEWTFGQVLPVLLAVAPLAAILEHFLLRQSSNNTSRQSSDQIALTQAQSETVEAETQARAEARDEGQEGAHAEIDHQYLRSIEYRGVLLLAMVPYIEVGIFFVADLSPGITEPFLRLGVAFFILNPMLQYFWISCTRCTSHMNWSSLIKKTSLGAVFSASMSISVNEFLQVSTKSKTNSKDSIYSYFVSFIILLSGIVFSGAALGHNCILAGEIRPFFVLFCIILPVSLVGMYTALGFIGPTNQGPLEFSCCLGVCLFVELAWYGSELFMDKVEMAPKHAVSLRCILLLCILATLVVVKFTTSIAPSTVGLVISIMASVGLWTLVGTISSFVERRRTMTPTT